MLPQQEVVQAKEANKEAILEKPNVVGVGVGFKRTDGRVTGELSVVVMVRKKLPIAGLEPQDVLPNQVDSVDVDVIEVGEIRAFQSPTDRWRPAPGGVSIGHFKITAGTLGCAVRDRASGTRLILSNNHVLANSNDAVPGDPIYQPGPYDGGSGANDVFAHLERFCEILFTTQPGVCSLANAYAGFGNALARLVGSQHRVQVYQTNLQAVNQVDAAVARPVNDADLLDEILEIGVVSGTVPASLGMAVRKTGRTTGFTTGTINLLDSTVDVSYGSGRVARFEDQLVAGPMSQGGDSGSLVVAGDSLQAVGLLFAGSAQTTIFSPIQAVLDCLEVDI
jgi:hypothetical protein